MIVEIQKLVYRGADSPRGKVYWAAWVEDDDWAVVGWGPGHGRPQQAQRKTFAAAMKKLREKRREGYEVDMGDAFVVDDSGWKGWVPMDALEHLRALSTAVPTSEAD